MNDNSSPAPRPARRGARALTALRDDATSGHLAVSIVEVDSLSGDLLLEPIDERLPFLSHLAPGDREEYIARLKDAARTASAFDVIYRAHEGGPGSMRLVRSAPFRGPDGTLEAYVVMVSAPERGADLASRRPHIARVLDRMDETVIGFDGDGLVVCWNRAAQQRFGWSARAIWRQPGPDFVRPVGQDFGEWIEHLMAGRTWQGTLTVRTAEGDDAQIAVRSVGLFDYDDDGKMAILVGARQCPEHAGGPQSDTCPVCASRNERQLLLSALSHELDAPVGLLGETARVLRRRVAAGDLEVVAELAADVGEQAERIRGMFRNVTVLAGLDTELVLGPLAVAEVVTDAAETHLRQFPQRRLVVSHEGVLPPAMGERVALIEVLTNLLSNAEKFSPRSEEIRIETAVVGDRVAVRVLDRGPGIPRSEVERIFEPFYRAPGATSPGMGLGLAVARRLAELMGAELTASPRVGGGAVFELRLRAALAGETSSSGGR